MLNGIWHNPTKIIFGKQNEDIIGEEIAKHSKNILFHYGGKSIHTIGLYDKIIKSLKRSQIKFTELGGVKPNPRSDLVYQGIDVCRRNDIDFVLAVGGGSVIDSAKVIALGTPYEGDFFDFSNQAVPQGALKIGTVLTIPGAGSESSPAAVISHEDKGIKYPYFSKHMIPKFSILNPEYSLSLSPAQTSAGIVDAISHVLERYFSDTPYVALTDRICEALIKTLVQYGTQIVSDPDNYELRAEIMWACKLAHDDTAGFGRQHDWACHGIVHEIAVEYDSVHGEALAVVFPAWMKYVMAHKQEKLLQFAHRVMDVPHGLDPKNSIIQAIESYQSFLKTMGMPTSLEQLGVMDDTKFQTIAENSVRFMQSGTIGNFMRLKPDDTVKILKLAS